MSALACACMSVPHSVCAVSAGWVSSLPDQVCTASVTDNAPTMVREHKKTTQTSAAAGADTCGDATMQLLKPPAVLCCIHLAHTASEWVCLNAMHDCSTAAEELRLPSLVQTARMDEVFSDRPLPAGSDTCQDRCPALTSAGTQLASRQSVHEH